MRQTHAERDAWITGTAIVHAITVVTRNVADCKMGGVKVFDPWGQRRYRIFPAVLR